MSVPPARAGHLARDGARPLGAGAAPAPPTPDADAARGAAAAGAAVAVPSAWIDLAKALASQLIVAHHLALYGPMCDVAAVLAPALLAALAEHARLVVQVFLVVGGFLAANALWPSPDAPPPVRPRDWPRLAWRRYQRLAQPYLLALAAVLVAAWLARGAIGHPSLPAAPSAGQLAAHLLLLQDVLGVESLSAGFWYVAIDLQLYLLLAALAALVRAAGGRLAPVARAAVSVGGVLALALGSLLVWNRDSALDVWAPYFLGAYGLGVLARWARPLRAGRGLAALGLLAVVALALVVEWRSRIALAGATAVLLCLAPEPAAWRRPVAAAGRALVAWLARISYPVFLLHYPVLLVVSAVVGSQWPDSVPANALGLGVAWGLSLAAGAGLYRMLARAAR